jgi:hypothetical protein
MQVFLNQFFIKTLTEEDRRFYKYRCVLEGEVTAGQEFQKIGSACYKVGTDAVRLGHQVVARSPIREDKLRGEDWRLEDFQEVILNPADPKERKAIAQLELKKLKADLKSRMPKTHIKDSGDGKLTLWKDHAEKFGNGWKVYRSTVLGLVVQINGDLLLEIDSHSKFYSPYTLHQWQEEYPDCLINYVLNTYPDKEGQYRTWHYEERTDESPHSIILRPSEQTLAQYHLGIGATSEDVENSYVVYVKSSGYGENKNQVLPHLSRRLQPILTMDTFASLAENPNVSKQQKSDLSDVFRDIKININTRFQKIQKLAISIIRQVYGITIESSFSPLEVVGSKLEKAILYGKQGVVSQTVGVFSKGCAKAGELKFGCLNLADNTIAYPTEIKRYLEDVARSTGVETFLEPPRIKRDIPPEKIGIQLFWTDWAASGIKTILVIGKNLRKEQWQKIRVGALQAGIATQFMRPMPQREEYRARNIVLGLLAKAAWQSVRLETIDHPQAAELIIGFDTGTNRDLYYGTAAFAVLADGQSLGWELPNVQRGETLSGEAVWQTVSSLLMKFYQVCGRLPKQVLLMRDGLIQDDEFERTIAALEEQGLGIDVIGVRKSGGGRMATRSISDEGIYSYKNAPEGMIVLFPSEKSFLLVGAPAYQGSARPLRVMHEYGNTPLELIARQTYQQCQLHPASGYRHARLPWVLHLADKSSKEFQKVGSIAPFQHLDREKLFSV